MSDSGISDGDSEGAGRRARRLGALRELARRLQAALAPNSPAQRAIAKVIHKKYHSTSTAFNKSTAANRPLLFGILYHTYPTSWYRICHKLLSLGSAAWFVHYSAFTNDMTLMR